jgi:hypothetical protein
MIIEASLRYTGSLKESVEVRATRTSVLQVAKVLPGAYLYSFSSSITCMPCSYCSLVGASPTAAKWPFIVITEGAVALDVAGGRGELEPPLLSGGVDIARRCKAFYCAGNRGRRGCGR